MNFLKRTSVKEEAKKTKREVGRTQRELDRERQKLDREEAKLVQDIRKAAAKGGRDAEVRVLAKQLVQVRNARTRMLGMNAQLGGVKTKMTTMAATETMGDAMKKTSKAMERANKKMDVRKMQKNMVKFEENMERMNVTEEMMDDALGVLDEEDTEAEVDAVTRQVLDEIGVDLDANLAAAPTGTVTREAAQPTANAADKETEGPLSS